MLTRRNQNGTMDYMDDPTLREAPADAQTLSSDQLAPTPAAKTPMTEEQPQAVATPLEQPMPEPTPTPTMPTMPPPPPVVPKKSSPLGFVGKVLIFLVLFAVGMGLSALLRNLFPNGISTGSLSETLPTQDRVNATPTPTTASDPYAGWKSYQVLSGATRQAISGIVFRLPADVLSPICDGTTCASQGTYLPGGTRFTVAARGRGQLLSDFRGKIVSDLAGKAFTVKESTFSGRPTVWFSGSFTGSTAGGYAFSQMRGLMIEVNDDLSLEINHFTPSGITANFASDDVLFDKILQTVELTGAAPAVLTTPTQTTSPTPTLLPSESPTTLTPTASPSATPPGY